jgi:putative acetyltransferase
MGSILVRHEQADDKTAVARLNDAAFGQPDESRIVDAIRLAGHSTISLVATDGPTIVGHILFTPVDLEAPGPAIPVMALGPMSVLPTVQRRGVGSKLVEEGLGECKQLGYQAVVVVGHPAFYPRFGFRPASSYGIRCDYRVPDDVFMAIELVPGSLNGRSGRVRYLEEFGSG